MRKQLLCIGLVTPLFFFPISTHVTGSNTLKQKVRMLTDLRQTLPHHKRAGHIQRAGQGSVTPQTANEWNKLNEVVLGEQVDTTPSSTLDMIQASRAWEELGVKGEGTLISIIDTGVNPDHPDFPPPRDKRVAEQKTGKTNKVISGYNWADRNQVTKDVGESQHGVHVAGIAAANGKIKGVAPEAQLLSEKVFSNYHGEMAGLSESILFAINDSISKKADVINLSLGSSAGYVDETNTEQYAIRRAVENGIIVVAAAGNDAYFGSDTVKSENADFSMVGSPGIAPDALSVASANATTLAGLSFSVSGVSGVNHVVYLVAQPSTGDSTNPAQALTKPTELVYVGKGKKADYNISVKEKVVFIERGDISFDDKLKLAKAAGAAGVVVYNNEPGPLIMNANEAKNLPAVSILKRTGEQIVAQLKKGKKVTIHFDGQYTQNPLPYPNGGTLSGFSSWGPTPDLQFKPEITAPGGGILSTVLEADYGVKSGTSMATPHVAGGMALLKQSYKKQGRKLEGRPLVETLKAAVMNTAEPIIDPRDISTMSTVEKSKSYPYSPRVQGAGMMQVVKASRTPVVITDQKKKAGVSLGEVGKKTTFSLFLDNKFGKEPITYELRDEYGVLTDLTHNGKNMLTSIPLSGAHLRFSSNKVTVPVGKRQEVKVTLTIPEQAERNIFAEGFISFTPDKKELPTLRVPYYGFYGDWDEPRVMDSPMWERDSQEKRTGVKTTWFHDKENDKWKFRDYVGVNGVDENGNVMIDPENIAFSPNGDGHYDVAAPSVTFLRNAEQVIIDVVDRSGNIVHSLIQDEKVSKFDQSKRGVAYYYTEREEWGWNGQTYDANKGEYVPVPDGAYQFVIRATIDGRNANWQTLTLPIRVDRKAPSVSASLDGNKVRFGSRDKDIQGYVVYVDGKKTGGPYPATSQTTIISQPYKKITVVTYDYAGNVTITPVNGKSDITAPYVQFPNDIFEQVLVTNQSHVPIHGKVENEDMLDRVSLSIHNQPIKLETDGSFHTVLTLPEGLTYVTYSATDAFGNNRTFTQRVIVDSQAPQVLIANEGSEEPLYDASTKKMLMPVRLSYRDMGFKGQVKLNGQIIARWEEDQIEKSVQKNFTQLVPVRHGENKLLIEGLDDAKNVTSLPVNCYVDTNAGTAVLQHGEQRIAYNNQQTKQAPALAVGFTKASYEAVRGDSLVVVGRVVAETPTRLHFYYGDRRLQADVNERGDFRLTLTTIKDGKETLTVVANDPLGREAKAEATIIGKKQGKR